MLVDLAAICNSEQDPGAWVQIHEMRDSPARIVRDTRGRSDNSARVTHARFTREINFNEGITRDVTQGKRAVTHVGAHA